MQPNINQPHINLTGNYWQPAAMPFLDSSASGRPDLRPRLAHVDAPGYDSFRRLSDVVKFQEYRYAAGAQSTLGDLKNVKKIMQDKHPPKGWSTDMLKNVNTATLKILALFIGAAEDMECPTGEREELQNKAAAIIRHAVGVPTDSLAGTLAERTGMRKTAAIINSELYHVPINWIESLAANIAAKGRSPEHIAKDLKAIEHVLLSDQVGLNRLDILEKLVRMSRLVPGAIEIVNRYLDARVTADERLPGPYLPVLRAYLDMATQDQEDKPAGIKEKACVYAKKISTNLTEKEHTEVRNLLRWNKESFADIDPVIYTSAQEAYSPKKREENTPA